MRILKIVSTCGKYAKIFDVDLPISFYFDTDDMLEKIEINATAKTEKEKMLMKELKNLCSLNPITEPQDEMLYADDIIKVTKSKFLSEDNEIKIKHKGKFWHLIDFNTIKDEGKYVCHIKIKKNQEQMLIYPINEEKTEAILEFLSFLTAKLNFSLIDIRDIIDYLDKLDKDFGKIDALKNWKKKGW